MQLWIRKGGSSDPSAFWATRATPIVTISVPGLERWSTSSEEQLIAEDHMCTSRVIGKAPVGVRAGMLEVAYNNHIWRTTSRNAHILSCSYVSLARRRTHQTRTTLEERMIWVAVTVTEGSDENKHQLLTYRSIGRRNPEQPISKIQYQQSTDL